MLVLAKPTHNTYWKNLKGKFCNDSRGREKEGGRESILMKGR